MQKSNVTGAVVQTRAMLVNRVVRTTRHLYSFLQDRSVNIRTHNNEVLLQKAKDLGYSEEAIHEFGESHRQLTHFDNSRGKKNVN